MRSRKLVVIPILVILGGAMALLVGGDGSAEPGTHPDLPLGAPVSETAAPGPLRIARSPGGARSPVAVTHVAGGTAGLRIVTGPGNPVTGRLESAAGAPIGQRDLYLCGKALPPLASTRTGPDGSFRFNGVPPAGAEAVDLDEADGRRIPLGRILPGSDPVILKLP